MIPDHCKKGSLAQIDGSQIQEYQASTSHLLEHQSPLSIFASSQTS
ncbi:MAG: hypothetical protein WCG25_04190 [bacterium]